jgi:arylsulfatase A-like enzyme
MQQISVLLTACAKRLVLVCIIVATGLLSSGCQKSPDVGQTIVLATIDTWRRDATGFLGSVSPSPTPFVDKLAQTGIVATRAVAPVPQTGPSHYSMMSGRWPWRDGFRVNMQPLSGTEPPMLSEVLQKAGWTTAAFVSCMVLDHRQGFSSGFSHYDDQLELSGSTTELGMPERDGRETVERAIRWIREQHRSDDLFIWIHLFDPHFPYVRNDPRWRGNDSRDRYLAEVAHADAMLEKLAIALAEDARLPEAVSWIVVSDHGEGLGEHGEDTHGFMLHGATSNIPLVIAGPGVEPRVIESLTSTVDIFPTLAALAGIPAESRDGVDLSHHDPAEDRAIPLESMFGASSFGLSPVFGLRSNEWLWETSPTDRLWNVREDPGELLDVAGNHPEIVENLEVHRRQFEMPLYEPPRSIDDESVAQLRALGYVGAPAPQSSQEDVRAFVRTGFKWFTMMLSDQRAGNLESAEQNAALLLENYPQSPEVWKEAGFVAVAMGDFARAADRFARAVELSPSSREFRVSYATALLELGRHREAELLFREILEEDPEHFHARFNLAHLLDRTNRAADANEQWLHFIVQHPEDKRAAEIRRMLIQRGFLTETGQVAVSRR